MKISKKVLLGSTFPVALIRRPATFTPISVEEAKDVLVINGFESFWGHTDTLNIIEKELEVDPKPKQTRPALILNDTNYPTLFDEVFNQAIIFSPSYVEGFRPSYGVEVMEYQIESWQCLLLNFD